MTSTSATSITGRHDSVMHELSQDECWELLSGHHVGRIGYVDPGGPVVLPLNYQAQDGRIWLQTASYNQLAVHLPGQQAAFEIDHIDAHTRTGWSVLVRGRAEHVLHDADGAPGDWHEAAPWPDGTRTMVLCLTPHQVSGRALKQGDVAPGAGHGPGTIQRRTDEAGRGPART